VTETAEAPVVTFPIARGCPFAPPEEYRAIREEPSLSKAKLPSGDDVWVVSRLDDARAALLETKLSSGRGLPGFPTLQNGARITPEDLPPSLIEMDPPQHGAARQTVIGEFTVRRMEALRPKIQAIVDERIDEMLTGPRPVDLMAALALPVPSLVICEMLGVPYEDHEFFQSRSANLLSATKTPQERYVSFLEFNSYLDELVTGKEADPGDDFIGRQIVKGREAGTYHHAALVRMAFLLLIAGHETTANMISLGTVALLENPEQLAMIRADSGKTLSAVEELLRFISITDTITVRLATEDVTIGAQTIRAGEGVLVLGYAANSDPAAFERPEELDIERGARHHVAFGFGPHQCLGQNLARLELQIVFDTLFRRIPELRLTQPVSGLKTKEAIIYGLRELPVTW
jgi:cytochrome P450